MPKVKKLIALTLTLAVMLVSLTGCAVLQNFLDVIAPQTSLENENKNETKDPPLFDETDSCEIDSLDKVNYYAAVCVLSKTPQPANSVGKSHKISMLTTYTTDENTESENTVTEQEQTEQQSKVYYYELSADDVFSFNKVNMLQIELTDEGGFLASKLGVGTVDVVITENCIWGDALITFRNGEKFFSCLVDGYSPGNANYGAYWHFSTHKYVDGFYIVKNLEQENYSFHIGMNTAGQVTSFECFPSENGGDRIDENVKIASSTVTGAEGGRFTLAELEAYFKNENYQENSETSPQNDGV